MPVDPVTQKRNDEENTSSHRRDGPQRDKSLERAYPAAQRHGGENRTDPAAPKGPVNIPVKK